MFFFFISVLNRNVHKKQQYVKILCDICHINSKERICYDCPPIRKNKQKKENFDSQEFKSKDDEEFFFLSFCFICFNKSHDMDFIKFPHKYCDEKNITMKNKNENIQNGMNNYNNCDNDNCYDNDNYNNVEIIENSNSIIKRDLYLLCSLCSEFAVRKCLGIVDETEINELLILLLTKKAKNLKNILINSNVGGEKKIIFMLQNLIIVSTK